MKIDLSKIDKESFNIKEGIIAGETCFLITPKDFDCKWTPDNLHLRSTIVNSVGDIISMGQKKFFNYNQSPELYPAPENYEYWRISDKIDGSLLIFSKVKDTLVHRTRGVFNAKIHENGAEIDYLLQKYPKIINFKGFPNYSLLTEWVSSTQKIILDYGKEPDIYLLDIIKHEDCSYLPGGIVSDIAEEMGLKRPEQYKFDTIQDIVLNCKTLIGREGYVLSYNNNQNRVKLKADNYLLLHRFKGNATLNNILDLFFEYDCPSFSDFKNKLIKTFDEDCFKMVEELAWQVVFAHTMAVIDGEKIKEDVEKLKHLSQKDFAIKNLTENKDYSSYYFEIRVKNELSHKSLRKLMERKLNV